MRYLIKGGVWKNSEDEILKAAVMKYGLNQWSRISSLLVRKSANQCKQRWYEWLDPSIKKTEWTREEEEKLLHLAKIFPQQWRTISPLVGRTPQQCFDQYERLLDKAQNRDSNDPNDPRKLKPGEIDPNPESKPPRPDPIDMDEDEKEMLAEARVRLANTKGKKAKRKAREKMIEEARRLAQLQKKRELKAAGIDYVQEFKKRKQKKGIQDYNKEVIFERNIPNYVYDTDMTEEPAPNIDFQSISFHQIENQSRLKEEAIEAQIDVKRIKKLKDSDMGKALHQMQKDQKNLFQATTKLILPEPQLQDKDLELLGKMNQVQEVSNVKNQATQALIGNYSQREVSMTPMRTPMAPDYIMQEAKNAVALQLNETPLMGGENPELQSELNKINPQEYKFQVPKTPNILHRMINTPNDNASSHLYGKSQIGNMTPSIPPTPLLADSNILFGNDNWEDQSSVSGINDEKLKQLRNQAAQQQIKNSIKNLPKPKNEYQIEVPEYMDEEREDERRVDQEDIQRQLQECKLQELEVRLRSRNLAIKMNMPRPFVIPNMVYDHIYKSGVDEDRCEAETMIESEMLKLLYFDAQNYPFQGAKAITFKTTLDHHSEADLKNASILIQNEIDLIKKEVGVPNHQQYLEINEKINKNIQFFEDQQIDLSECSQEVLLDFYKKEAESRRKIFLADQSRLDNSKQKLRLLLGGYQKIVSKHTKEIAEIYDDLQKKQLEFEVYSLVKNQEDNSIQVRLDEQRQYLAQLEFQNQHLREKYRELVLEKEELMEEEGLFSNC